MLVLSHHYYSRQPVVLNNGDEGVMDSARFGVRIGSAAFALGLGGQLPPVPAAVADDSDAGWLRLERHGVRGG